MCKSLPLFPDFTTWVTVDAIAVHPECVDWETDCTPPAVNDSAPGLATPAGSGQGACIPVTGDVDALLDLECGVSYFNTSPAYREQLFLDPALCGSLDAPSHIPRGSASSFVRRDGTYLRDWSVRVR